MPLRCRTTHIDHVALWTTDIERCQGFYVTYGIDACAVSGLPLPVAPIADA